MSKPMKPKKKKVQRHSSSSKLTKEISCDKDISIDDTRRPNNHPHLKKPSEFAEVSKASKSADLLVKPKTIGPAPLSDAQQAVLNKTYAHRKIVNNWNRYERTLSDESDEDRQHREATAGPPRATDFDEALNASKSVGRQFRFRDEQDWDDSTSADKEETQFGKLNVQDLASSLACIPLQTRLDIDKSYFPPELLEQFEIEARVQQTTYDLKRQSKETDANDEATSKDTTATNAVAIDARLEEELDALLNLAPPMISRSVPIPKTSTITEAPLITENSKVMPVNEDSGSSQAMFTQTTESLEHWLDGMIFD